MFSNIKEKLSKLKKTDNSIVHKLDKIKQSNQHSAASQNMIGFLPLTPDLAFDADKMSEMQEDIIKRIEDIVNSKSETINSNAESIKTLDNRFSKMDISISTIKKNLDEYSERFIKMEETILELLSLYEVVSNSVNPFVDDGDKISSNLDKIENLENSFKDIERNFEHLVNKIDSIKPSDHDENLEKIRTEFRDKFKDFENKLYEIHSNIKSNNEMQTEMGVFDNPDYQSTAAQQITIKPQSELISNNLPMLQNINNNPETSVVLLNWVEFLMEKVGRNNLMDVLDYYTEIGWIGEGVSSKILAYASGIDYYDEKPTWKLMPQDHTKSLMFIERLTGKKIDRSAFHKIERDIEKVKHHSESYFEI
jgi:flagellar protein FlaD